MLDEDEFEEFIERYDQLVEDTLNKYEEEFHNSDSSWNFQDQSEGEDFDIAWDMAQMTYGQSSSGNFIFEMKMAEVAIQKERNQPIDWKEAKSRLVQHGFPSTRDSISDFSPSRLASWASDEIINHAVASDVLRKFDPNQ